MGRSLEVDTLRQQWCAHVNCASKQSHAPTRGPGRLGGPMRSGSGCSSPAWPPGKLGGSMRPSSSAGAVAAGLAAAAGAAAGGACAPCGCGHWPPAGAERRGGGQCAAGAEAGLELARNRGHGPCQPVWLFIRKSLPWSLGRVAQAAGAHSTQQSRQGGSRPGSGRWGQQATAPAPLLLPPSTSATAVLTLAASSSRWSKALAREGVVSLVT